jgi:hypothetical protein
VVRGAIDSGGIAMIPRMTCPVCDGRRIIPQPVWAAVVPQAVERVSLRCDQALSIQCSGCHTRRTAFVAAGPDPASAAPPAKALAVLAAFERGDTNERQAMDALAALDPTLAPRTPGQAESDGPRSLAAQTAMLQLLAHVADFGRRATLHARFLRLFPRHTTYCCRREHCYGCHTIGFHEGLTCEEVQSRRTTEDMVTCPSCSVFLVRGDGCSSVRCGCGCGFSWPTRLEQCAVLFAEAELRARGVELGRVMVAASLPELAQAVSDARAALGDGRRGAGGLGLMPEGFAESLGGAVAQMDPRLRRVALRVQPELMHASALSVWRVLFAGANPEHAVARDPSLQALHALALTPEQRLVQASRLAQVSAEPWRAMWSSEQEAESMAVRFADQAFAGPPLTAELALAHRSFMALMPPGRADAVRQRAPTLAANRWAVLNNFDMALALREALLSVSLVDAGQFVEPLRAEAAAAFLATQAEAADALGERVVRDMAEDAVRGCWLRAGRTIGPDRAPLYVALALVGRISWVRTSPAFSSSAPNSCSAMPHITACA